MTGGITLWKDRGYKVEIPTVLTREQKERYGAICCSPRSGEEGQAKLLGSKVLLLGAGGLGSPPRSTSPPRASARSASSTTTWSTSPTSSARSSTRPTASASRRSTRRAEAIAELNPDVKVVTYPARLDASENIMEIIDDYDMIVDGVDNFPTRYLLNDATRAARQARSSRRRIFRFEGQVTVFMPHDGPVLPLPLPGPAAGGDGAVLRANGVLGVLPGTIGLLQATEASSS